MGCNNNRPGERSSSGSAAKRGFELSIPPVLAFHPPAAAAAAGEEISLTRDDPSETRWHLLFGDSVESTTSYPLLSFFFPFVFY